MTQSYFQLFSDPEFVKKNGIYLFREYCNNCKSLKSIDKLLYLDAHAYQSVVCTPVSLVDAHAYQSVPRCL